MNKQHTLVALSGNEFSCLNGIFQEQLIGQAIHMQTLLMQSGVT